MTYENVHVSSPEIYTKKIIKSVEGLESRRRYRRLLHINFLDYKTRSVEC